ncbi:hypothetical protein A1O1_01588 [Capronia coronata CBS 617.96]|uniref:F-box domain-containing protein n=1 Tax=Capronia coronata CBS 617.96 TaxID=1182541 RepID=W9YU90_9EURO|nr:uncharacterized protein A1O1_01588 [Capronia coronata CBS 617.96]EXJ96462.1 hypothetical protein A1O1_01588 [Capronia coronata CBS 617.96]
MPSDIVIPVEQNAPFLQLPSEIVYQILLYLPCQSLVSLSRTCRQLRELAQEDLLWANLLRPNLPPQDFPPDPYPSSSYRDLYISHHPYWFLPRHKIWISDESYIGRIMICKFDPRRGCIEGYRLLADRTPSSGILWPYKPSVVIHSFQPKVHLWLDDPILKLPHDIVPFNTRQGWWEAEIKMSVGRPGHNTSASFFLARDIPEHLQDNRMVVWPPRTIPGMPRVRAASVDNFRGAGHKPQKYDQISQTTFRLRQWSQFSTGMAHFGIRVGEEVSTWSTIDPALYTPTPEKPYQGIYVGDYAGHGCEFLLVMQTDKAPSAPFRPTSTYFRAMLGLREDEESGEEDEWEQSTHASSSQATVQDYDEDLYHGAIEAVKLTGDPNIPRGEHTFIADDIGPNGLIRIAQEHPFRGARVVKSRGHVAVRGFQNDEFIPSQLIMISHDRLAQYWVPFGHISFYERIDIDKLMDETFRQNNSGG